MPGVGGVAAEVEQLEGELGAVAGGDVADGEVGWLRGYLFGWVGDRVVG